MKTGKLIRISDHKEKKKTEESLTRGRKPLHKDLKKQDLIEEIAQLNKKLDELRGFLDSTFGKKPTKLH